MELSPGATIALAPLYDNAGAVPGTRAHDDRGVSHAGDTPLSQNNQVQKPVAMDESAAVVIDKQDAVVLAQLPDSAPHPGMAPTNTSKPRSSRKRRSLADLAPLAALVAEGVQLRVGYGDDATTTGAVKNSDRADGKGSPCNPPCSTRL